MLFLLLGPELNGYSSSSPPDSPISSPTLHQICQKPSPLCQKPIQVCLLPAASAAAQTLLHFC